MTFAFTFPGQGSQTVGMGKNLARTFPAARARVRRGRRGASAEAFRAPMWEGPAATLTLTANAQPALMAVSLPVMRRFARKMGGRVKPAFVAGHSLGEYSALAAAGAFSLAEAAQLLRLRGQAMQEAVPVGQGAMAALFSGPISKRLQRLGAAGAEGGSAKSRTIMRRGRS